MSLRGIWWVLWHLGSLSLFLGEAVAAAENLWPFPLLLPSLFPPGRPEGSPAPSLPGVGVGAAV